MGGASSKEVLVQSAIMPSTTTPWMFGRVASMLSDSGPATSTINGDEQLWQKHSSNFGTSLATSQKQSIEILKYSKTFTPDLLHPPTSPSGGNVSSSSSLATKQGGVPIMRIVGFFPGVSPRQVTQHLTNIHLRRRWDANYLAFDCIANFHHRVEPVHRAGSLFGKSCPQTLQQEVVASGENRGRVPWWCWSGASSLPPRPASSQNKKYKEKHIGEEDTVSTLDLARRALTRQLWGGMYPKSDRATIGATLSPPSSYPPPLLSSPEDASTTLGLRKGFTLLQHTWARHCVGSHMLDRLGFAPRSFLYEMYVTRLQYPDLHKVMLPVDVDIALNETLPYSTVYQGINWPPSSASSTHAMEPKNNNLNITQTLSDKILSSLTRQKNLGEGGDDGGASLAVPFSTVPVAMNYQEVLILPVFNVEADKERYLEFARTKGGSVFSDIPTVNYPWLTSSSLEVKNGSGHSIRDMDFKAVVEGASTLQGSFMIMTACNDVKPPDMVPLWMEKAVSKFFTTGAYAALHNGIVSAIKEEEE